LVVRWRLTALLLSSGDRRRLSLLFPFVTLGVRRGACADYK
jgi:hypothetical protein